MVLEGTLGRNVGYGLGTSRSFLFFFGIFPEVRVFWESPQKMCLARHPNVTTGSRCWYGVRKARSRNLTHLSYLPACASVTEVRHLSLREILLLITGLKINLESSSLVIQRV
jgi:hypothetical protein